MVRWGRGRARKTSSGILGPTISLAWGMILASMYVVDGGIVRID